MSKKTNTVTKTLKTYEAIEYLTFYKTLRNDPATKNKYNVLSLIAQWAIQKNIDVLYNIAKPYIDFSEEKQNDLINKYVESGKTHIVREIHTDDNNNSKEVDVTKVKDEYLDDFKKDYDMLQTELSTLLYQDNEVIFTAIDLDDEIVKCQDSDLNTDDLEFLKLFNKK